jgi:hypothetical protein
MSSIRVTYLEDNGKLHEEIFENIQLCAVHYKFSTTTLRKICKGQYTRLLEYLPKGITFEFINNEKNKQHSSYKCEYCNKEYPLYYKKSHEISKKHQQNVKKMSI